MGGTVPPDKQIHRRINIQQFRSQLQDLNFDTLVICSNLDSDLRRSWILLFSWCCSASQIQILAERSAFDHRHAFDVPVVHSNPGTELQGTWILLLSQCYSASKIQELEGTGGAQTHTLRRAKMTQLSPYLLHCFTTLFSLQRQSGFYS